MTDAAFTGAAPPRHGSNGARPGLAADGQAGRPGRAGRPARQFVSAARRLLAVADALPVVLLAVIAGAGSFTHIRDTAAQHGQRGPMSWAVTVCIDLTCVMAARERQRDKQHGIVTRRLSCPVPTVAGPAQRAAGVHGPRKTGRLWCRPPEPSVPPWQGIEKAASKRVRRQPSASVAGKLHYVGWIPRPLLRLARQSCAWRWWTG
jgi:hypothetical protein